VKKALWTAVALGSLLLAADLVCGLLILLAGAPDRLGGARFPESPRYRVAVMGDVQKGLGNFDTLLQAVKREGAGFILQTGDLVAENDPGHYRLVSLGVERSGLQLPFRVTPGNHDLKGSPENFEQRIGPLEQSFVVGKVAYVLVQNAWGRPPDPLKIDRLIAAAGPHQAVVLAMHQPPFDLQQNPKPEYAAFLAWLEKSGVTYLVCGHLHGYFRKTVGDTTVIVNGVGGDFDSWQLDQKVYLTLLDVDGDRIRDRVLEFPPAHGLKENVEHLAIGHVAEAYRRLPFVCWAATLLLAGGVGWGWKRLLRRHEPFEEAPG